MHAGRVSECQLCLRLAMDHDEKQDSMATVAMKEYPPSESYSSEPPPVGIYEVQHPSYRHFCTSVLVWCSHVFFGEDFNKNVWIVVGIVVSRWRMSLPICVRICMSNLQRDAEVSAKCNRCLDNSSFDKSRVKRPVFTSNITVIIECEKHINEVFRVFKTIRCKCSDSKGLLNT